MDIEAYILSYYVLCFGKCFFEFSKYLVNAYSLLSGQFGRDSMDTLCIVENSLDPILVVEQA